jgi:hypothetical protein
MRRGGHDLDSWNEKEEKGKNENEGGNRKPEFDTPSDASLCLADRLVPAEAALQLDVIRKWAMREN